MIRNNTAYQRLTYTGRSISTEQGEGADFFLMALLKPGGVVRSALFYSVLITALCFYFSHTRDVSYRLAACALVPGLLLGSALAVLERGLVLAQKRVAGQMNGLQTGFLLFFAYMIGYILFSSFFLSVPLGWAMDHFFGKASLCKEFALFSANYFIVLALASWIGYLRTASWPMDNVSKTS